MRKRLILGIGTLLMMLLVGMLLKQTTAPSAQKIDYSKCVPYPSPDGSFALLHDTQTGQVVLYSTQKKSVVKQFNQNYDLPSVGQAMWDRQSRRFLLSTDNPPGYSLWDIQTLKTESLDLSQYGYELANLKAVLSPDGKKVVAETERGILIWNIAEDKVYEFPLDQANLEDLARFTWINSKHFVAQYRRSSISRFILYDVEKRHFAPISVRRTLGNTETLPWATSDGWVVLLTKMQDEEWVGLLNPYSGDVELVFALSPLEKEGSIRWSFLWWNPNPDRPVIVGLSEEGHVKQVVRLDLSLGAVVGGTVVKPPFGVDAQGRMWGCRSEGVEVIGSLSHK